MAFGKRQKKTPAFEGRGVSGVESVRAEIYGIDEYLLKDLELLGRRCAFKIAAGFQR